MASTPDDLTALLTAWLGLPEKRFARKPSVNAREISCDCAGLITLACDQLSIPKPYALKHPRAVHYFAIIQEVGSSHLDQLAPGSLLTWRKGQVPKSGDSGHVLIVAGRPRQCSESVYELSVIDATRLHGGLVRRDIRLHTNTHGTLIGVQLHLTEAKVKRTAIYHAPLLGTRYCLGCGVPLKICLCGQIDVKHLDREVIILRHPHERKKTLSTVSLIKQRYPEVLVKEGRIFDPIRKKNCALLFPSPLISEDSSSRVALLDERDTPESGDQTLLLLDATWRKAKRMIHDNPWLAALPRVSLEPKAASDYILRKGPGGAALSTVEAFARAQNDGELQTHLRNFMAKQVAVMGEDVYARNYHQHHNYSPLSC